MGMKSPDALTQSKTGLFQTELRVCLFQSFGRLGVQPRPRPHPRNSRIVLTYQVICVTHKGCLSHFLKLLWMKLGVWM